MKDSIILRVDLPITSIFRTKYGEYPEYHISLDDFNVVTKKGIRGGFIVAKEAINILQKDIPKNQIICEPQMVKGLYNYLNKVNIKTIPIMNFFNTQMVCMI